MIQLGVALHDGNSHSGRGRGRKMVACFEARQGYTARSYLEAKTSFLDPNPVGGCEVLEVRTRWSRKTMDSVLYLIRTTSQISLDFRPRWLQRAYKS